MGKKLNTKQQIKQDPSNFKISKKKTFMINIRSYMRMLKTLFPQMSSKKYLQLVHKYIGKCQTKLKNINPNELVQIRDEIQICKQCDLWSSRKEIIQCIVCQDVYHLTCRPNSGYKGSRDQWKCNLCKQIKNESQDKNKYMKKFVKIDKCHRCKVEKNQSKQMISCIRCRNKFHQQCFEVGKVACNSCNQSIKKNVNQKYRQPSLLQYKFEKTPSGKKIKKQTQFNQDSKIKDSQETQASTFGRSKFTKNYPKMSQEQIQQFKSELLYAIEAKGMTYKQQLIPIQCSLDEDSQQSLDFGQTHMNHQQYEVYRNYKKQPIGPFKLVYKQKMGYDVTTAVALPKGMIVCEYVGQVVTWRTILNDQKSKTNDSLMELRAGKNADETLYIRPQKYSNIARFINGINNVKGKNSNNLQSFRYLAKGKPAIILYTIKNIKEGESLLYNYNAGALDAYPTQNFE